MKVNFLDLKAGYTELKPQIDASIKRVLESGWYVLGSEVDLFEEEYAKYCESSYCVGVANGLDALHLGLLALGVGPGDEVIVPSNTYIATWLAVSQCGAKPVPVEPDIGTFNIAPGAIVAAITEKTKVILPVHLYGQSADLDPILEIAKTHGLKVLEDAAQAHGGRYKGRRIGAHGDLVAWSFYPGKNLGAYGDGGAITTDNAELAEKIRVLRNYGSKVKYVNEICGFNSRLDPLQAAVLRVKLGYLDEWNSRRSTIAASYQSELNSSHVVLPYSLDYVDPVWHLFVILVADRNLVQKKLADMGVGTIMHYPIPPHCQKAYSEENYSAGQFPIASKISDECISLPIGPHLDKKGVSIVIEAINSIL
jgi:dTDP-4-amino-4,6-dideoxygalactose transaminase